MKSKHPFKENKNEIFYNLINAALAGALVLLGSFTSGEITHEAMTFAIIASGIVMISQFKNYWDGEKGSFTTHIFSFIKI